MREEEIRPAEIYREYLRLCAESARDVFDMSRAIGRDCPSCTSPDHHKAFIKHGFPYHECDACGTLFANPLPPDDEFTRFYTDSEAAEYWAEVFVPTVSGPRKRLLIQPKVKQILELAQANDIEVRDILDVGAGPGVFLEEWRASVPNSRLHALEPHEPSVRLCQEKGIRAYATMAHEAPSELESVADVVTSFEVLEHVSNPFGFACAIRKFVRPGGMAVVTTLLADGFDIQVLWEKANAVTPPCISIFVLSTVPRRCSTVQGSIALRS